MSLTHALCTYLNINLMILIGFSGLGLFSIIGRKAQWKATTTLKLHYTILMIIIGLTLIHPFLPKNKVFSPMAKIWSAQAMKNFSKEYITPNLGGHLSMATSIGTHSLQTNKIFIIGLVIVLLFWAIGCLFIIRDLITLFNITQKSYLIKKLGRVHILVSDTIQVPFSYWIPGRANVILPSSLIEQRENYKIAIAHEIQHHRQGDTRWVYVMWGLRLICIFNPIIHFWNRWITEIQEFACDEALVDRRKVESQAYARCLVQVAQSALNQKRVPVCATGLLLLVECNFLKRRIEKMLFKSSHKTGRSISVLVGILITTVMGVTTYASNGLIQDRRLTLAQANAMATRTQTDTGFPLIVNDLVLTQLN